MKNIVFKENEYEIHKQSWTHISFKNGQAVIAVCCGQSHKFKCLGCTIYQLVIKLEAQTP